jgi:heme exporter protein B
MNAFFSIVRRDLRLALRQGADSLMIVTFFVLTVVLFPFGIGPEPGILERIAPGIIWVTALLASMLSLDRMFIHDYEDGSLDLFIMGPTPTPVLVLAKTLAHWLTTGLPLLVVSPLLALLLHMKPDTVGIMLLVMLIGTPTLSLIGSIGAALTLGARRGGVLLSLLVLPLYVPVLIFAVSAIDAVAMGFSSSSQILILGAFLCGALPLAMWGTAAALKHALD